MLSLTTVLALLTATATAAPATFFSLTNFVASDYRVPSRSHAVSFTVSNPNAVFEQGGNAPRNCSISWGNGAPPTCLTTCSGDGYPYFTRITPGTYNGAYDFSLDVLEYYVYRNSALNNATLPVKQGTAGYACSRGGQSTVCTYQGTPGANVTFSTTYGGTQPSDTC